MRHLLLLLHAAVGSAVGSGGGGGCRVAAVAAGRLQESGVGAGGRYKSNGHRHLRRCRHHVFGAFGGRRGGRLSDQHRCRRCVKVAVQRR